LEIGGQPFGQPAKPDFFQYGTLGLLFQAMVKATGTDPLFWDFRDEERLEDFKQHACKCFIGNCQLSPLIRTLKEF